MLRGGPGWPIATVDCAAPGLSTRKIVVFCRSATAGYENVGFAPAFGQADNAFKSGQYALANLLVTPVQNVMMGVEGGWIHRENNSDGFDVDDYHVQVSARYNFSISLGGSQ